MKERKIRKILKNWKKADKHTRKAGRKSRVKTWLNAKTFAVAVSILLMVAKLCGAFAHEFHPIDRLQGADRATVKALGTEYPRGKTRNKLSVGRRIGNCHGARSRTPARLKQK
ncbi:hypothetical protein [Paraburkholderia flagellata]|uniref:hypothetical protein n=1 Tax=Paraburkholderia flagellata TaxID=2883241 RepID=UPI001F4368E5|nr:hypothetical protein [Paraburkholderia flagellata]